MPILSETTRSPSFNNWSHVKCHWNCCDDDELTLRLRPLREHWEARGPGMLRFAKEAMPWLEIPASVEIRLLHPSGGGGRLLNESTIEFQAVLANPHPQLPEVVRLAWLALQLANPTAPSKEATLIPLSIQAAEHVELARWDEATVELALRHWLRPASQPSLASTLLQWWEHDSRESAKRESTWLEAVETLNIH